MYHIKVILNYFELASDFKVNFLKSRIGGIWVYQTAILCFEVILNCDVMKIPFKYLRMPVGGLGTKWLVE